MPEKNEIISSSDTEVGTLKTPEELFTVINFKIHRCDQEQDA